MRRDLLEIIDPTPHPTRGELDQRPTPLVQEVVSLDLVIDEDVRIVIEGPVVKTETLSNQDGSVNLVFVGVTGLKKA